MQIEDVFDDEAVQFSIKENGPKISDKKANMDFPPIIKSEKHTI